MAAKSDFARRTHNRRTSDVTWHTWLYHDPLSLMLAKLIDWMKTQFHYGMSYYNHLVKPESRLNAGTVFRAHRGSWGTALSLLCAGTCR